MPMIVGILTQNTRNVEWQLMQALLSVVPLFCDSWWYWGEGTCSCRGQRGLSWEEAVKHKCQYLFCSQSSQSSISSYKKAKILRNKIDLHLKNNMSSYYYMLSWKCPGHVLRTGTCLKIPGTELDGQPYFVHIFIHVSTVCPCSQSFVLSYTWNKDGYKPNLPNSHSEV